MTFTDDEVLQILRLLEQSNFDELRLETNDLKLVARRRGAAFTTEEWERSAAAPVGAVAVQQSAAVGRPQVEASAAGDGAALASGTVQAASVADEPGLLAVTAPNLGTFYRAPKPGAPPFVEVGTCVTEDDTVCLLEVMKCFITVKAKMRGEIVRVCAENAQMVEFGQNLFLIRPE